MKPSVIYTYSHVLCNNVSVNDRPRFRWWANKTVLDYKQKFIYDIERKGWTQLRCLITASSGGWNRQGGWACCPPALCLPVTGAWSWWQQGCGLGRKEAQEPTPVHPCTHTCTHTHFIFYTLFLLYLFSMFRHTNIIVLQLPTVFIAVGAIGYTI